MKKYFYLLIFAIALNIVQVFAQNHFIYIQSEGRQPFTVTLNDKSFNSTAAGYVIIPRLKKGEHDLIVKFKDATLSPVRFNSIIDKTDVGYTLQDLNSSISLTNIQTFEKISAIPFDTYAKNDKTPAVTNTTESEKNNTTTKPNVADKPSKTGTKKPVIKKEAPVVVLPKLKKGITKISEVQNDNNISLIFIDVQGANSDTIDVVIPTQKNESNQSSINKLSFNSSLFRWASAEISNNDESIPEYQNGYNTKCVHLLTKEDFARLRKKMAAESNETKMINEAVKFSKNKCFTTLQVKMLASLFPKDAGKFKLFEALYSSVYDYIEYPVLEKEFKDVVYQNKLMAMLHR